MHNLKFCTDVQQPYKIYWLKLEAAFWPFAKEQSKIRQYAFWQLDQKHLAILVNTF